MITRRSRRNRQINVYPDFTRPAFIADQLQAFASDPDLAEFCRSAFYVDAFEPHSVFGVSFVALRAHIPPALAKLAPVTCEADLERITQEFRTMQWAGTTLWRCDVWCTNPGQPIFSLVGTCTSELVEELRRTNTLTIIDVANWGTPEPAMVELVVTNDPNFWATVRL